MYIYLYMRGAGVVSREDLDSRCMDQLKALPETTALEVKKCRETHLASINSNTSYNIYIYYMYKYIYYKYTHTHM